MHAAVPMPPCGCAPCALFQHVHLMLWAFTALCGRGNTLICMQGASPPVTRRVALALAPFQGSTVWPHSALPMHAALQALAEPRALRWNAGRPSTPVLADSERRRIIRFHCVQCLFPVYIVAFNFFFMLMTIFDDAVESREKVACAAEGGTANSLSASPAGAPVATGPPAAPDAVHGGDVAWDIGEGRACEHAQSMMKVVTVLWVLLVLFFLTWWCAAMYVMCTYGQPKYSQPQEAHVYKRHEAEGCNREHEKHMQLLQMLYLSHHLSKRRAEGAAQQAAQLAHVAFSMCAALETRDAGGSGEYATQDMQCEAAQRAAGDASGAHRGRLQVVAWLEVLGDASVSECVHEQPYDEALSWD